MKIITLPEMGDKKFTSRSAWFHSDPLGGCLCGDLLKASMAAEGWRPQWPVLQGLGSTG